MSTTDIQIRFLKAIGGHRPGTVITHTRSAAHLLIRANAAMPINPEDYPTEDDA